MGGLGMGLGLAGGAVTDELHAIVAERLMQQKFAEQQRAALAEEAMRAQQMEEQQKWRELQQQQMQEERLFRRGIAENQMELSKQAANDRQVKAITEDTAPGADLQLGQVAALHKAGRGNLVKLKPVGLMTQGPQTQLGGGSATIAAGPAPDMGGTSFTGTAGQLRQQRTDERLEGVAEANQAIREQQLALQAAVAEGRLSAAAANAEIQRLKFEAAQTAATEKKTAQADTLKEQADTALETVRQLKTMPGLSAAVGMKGITNYLPGTKAADFRSYLSTLRSQMTLPKLRAMRGLGAISDLEFQALNAAATALNADMSEAQFMKELDAIEAGLSKLSGPSAGGKKDGNGLREKYGY